MKKLTKWEAIREHRKMWLWIARKSIKKGIKVDKIDYFKENFYKHVPRCRCFCCEYACDGDYNMPMDCMTCPVVWDVKNSLCYFKCALYAEWNNCKYDEAIKAAFIAYRISQLPVNKEA